MCVCVCGGGGGDMLLMYQNTTMEHGLKDIAFYVQNILQFE